MRRLFLALLAGCIGVVVLVTWQKQAPPGSASIPAENDASQQAPSPRTPETPTQARLPPSPRAARPGGTQAPPRNTDQRDVLSSDDLFEQDQSAWVEIQRGAQQVFPSFNACVADLQKTLTRPVFLEFTIVLDVEAIVSDTGPAELRFTAIDSVEWPDELGPDDRDCFRAAIEDYRAPASHEYVYRMAYPIRLALAPAP